jgi:MFS family permease
LTLKSDKLPPALRVWTHRDYAIYMAGCIPNYMTFWMQKVGIAWLAWELTHSPFWLGVVTAMDLAPLLLLAPLAGALSDRWEPLRLFRITQICILAHGLALPALYFSGLMRIEVLLVLTAYSGIVYPFMSTARFSIVPRLLPRIDLPSAIGVDSAFFHGSRFLGPAIAGFVIPAFGVGGTFVVNAAGSAGLLTALFFVRLRPAEASTRKTKNILADVREAFSYVRHHGGIGPIFLVLTVASTFTRPVQDMMPGIVDGIYHAGASGLAWMMSSLGVGAMMSAGWIAVRGRTAGLTSVIILGAFSVSLGVMGLVSTDHLAFGIPIAVFTGFSLNTMSTSVQTLVQSAVADEMRGRVMGLYIMIFRGAPAFGSLLIGAASTHFGLRNAFVAAGCMGLLSWAAALPRRRAIAVALEREHVEITGGRAVKRTAAV